MNMLTDMEFWGKDKSDVLFKVFNSITDNRVNIDEYMYMGTKKEYRDGKFSHYKHLFKNRITRNYLNMMEGNEIFIVNQ